MRCLPFHTFVLFILFGRYCLIIVANASPLSVSPPSMFTQQPRDQQQQQQQQPPYHLKTSSEHNSSMAKPISTYRTESKEKESNVSNNNNHNNINNNGKAVDFKIPSGKEGSLKHRILTRPYGEKDAAPKQANHKQSLPPPPPTHSHNNNGAAK